MTLKEYQQKLNDFIDKNPQALKLTVIHSSDDEGNDFHPVVFDPGTPMVHLRGEYKESPLALADSICIN
jgi:hypothetical protein